MRGSVPSRLRLNQLVLLASVGLPCQAYANFIAGVLTPTNPLDGLHVPDGTGLLGQTFTALPGQLSTISFVASSSVLPSWTDAHIRLLVTDVAPTGNDPAITTNTLYPTTVLFDSADITVPVNPPAGTQTFTMNGAAFQVISVNVGDLSLQSGETYAFLIDGLSDVGMTADGNNLEFGINDEYSGGAEFYYGGLLGQSVASAFADTQNWSSRTDVNTSLAFQADFIPEPTSVGLLGVGSLVLLVSRRRHRQC